MNYECAGESSEERARRHAAGADSVSCVRVYDGAGGGGGLCCCDSVEKSWWLSALDARQ